MVGKIQLYVDDYKIVKFDDEIIGKTFSSKRYGEFYVVGATDIIKKHYRMFLCKFFNTNSTGLFRKDKIVSGEITISTVAEEDHEEELALLESEMDEILKEIRRTDSKKKTEELNDQRRILDKRINYLYEFGEYDEEKNEKEVIKAAR